MRESLTDPAMVPHWEKRCDLVSETQADGYLTKSLAFPYYTGLKLFRGNAEFRGFSRFFGHP